jgi:DnaK suppressor protein
VPFGDLSGHINDLTSKKIPLTACANRKKLEPISKMRIRVQGKARGGEKAQHTREYVSILRRPVTPPWALRPIFEMGSSNIFSGVIWATACEKVSPHSVDSHLRELRRWRCAKDVFALQWCFYVLDKYFSGSLLSSVSPTGRGELRVISSDDAIMFGRASRDVHAAANPLRSTQPIEIICFRGGEQYIQFQYFSWDSIPKPTSLAGFTMKKKDIEYFRKLLTERLENLLAEASETLSGMTGEIVNFPDPTDRASLEADRNFMLRIRDRERRLILKIREALERIDKGTYGICETCGSEISVKRMKARPVTTQCIDCKTKEEAKEDALGV